MYRLPLSLRGNGKPLSETAQLPEGLSYESQAAYSKDS